MELFDLIVWLVIGAIVGSLANFMMNSRGFGLSGNITFGIVGAIIGGALLPLFDFVLASGIIGGIINAFIGSLILVLTVRFARRAT